MSPEVSVIIPTYNRALLLQKAIQSVLDQTFQDFEIIVVNNYSEDNTIEVVKSFNDERIKIINIRNEGIIAKSRNRGLKESGGNYIAFLDSDDMWLPEKLELQVGHLREHPQYYLVYSNARYIVSGRGAKGEGRRAKGRETSNLDTWIQKGLLIKPGTLRQGNVFKAFVNGNFFMPQLTVLMKREVFETVGFFTENPSAIAAEDYEYWLRVTLRYKIGFVDKPLALYREHSDSLIHSTYKGNFAHLSQKGLSLFLESSTVPEVYKNDIEARIHELYFMSALYYWKASEKELAKKDLGKFLDLRHLPPGIISRVIFLSFVDLSRIFSRIIHGRYK